MPRKLLSRSMLERIARRFKILGEPVRMELLNQLYVQGEMNVQDLVDATGQTQANVSKHLLLMAREGVLSRRKDGLNVFYGIADPTFERLFTLVSGRIREEAAAEYEWLTDQASLD